eukprot:1178974-Amphidinium_carterae.1
MAFRTLTRTSVPSLKLYKLDILNCNHIETILHKGEEKEFFGQRPVRALASKPYTSTCNKVAPLQRSLPFPSFSTLLQEERMENKTSKKAVHMTWSQLVQHYASEETAKTHAEPALG